MIDPQHTCHFTKIRRTDLSISEDENCLQSAGVSLRVLLSALAEPDIVWFSRAYGDLGDNLDIIAVREDALAPGWLEVQLDVGPITRLIGDLFPVREYALSDAVAEWVGLDYATEHYDNGDRKIEYERRERESSNLPLGVLFLLFCHDECFCNTTPLTDISVRRVITQVLRMHNFYYRKDYDWALATNDILSLLTRYKALRLRSHPATRLHSAVTNIGIPKEGWSNKQWRDQNRQPRFEWAGSVTFDDVVAHFRPSRVAP